MSEVITDKLTGKTSAGDVDVTSEGGAVTFQLQQGLAKAWFTFNYTAVQDSFGISSVTDEATGHCFGNFSSTMSNDDFAHPFATGAFRDRYEGTGPDATTSRTNTLETYNSSSVSADDAMINCAVFGDLA